MQITASYSQQSATSAAAGYCVPALARNHRSPISTNLPFAANSPSNYHYGFRIHKTGFPRLPKNHPRRFKKLESVEQAFADIALTQLGSPELQQAMCESAPLLMPPPLPGFPTPPPSTLPYPPSTSEILPTPTLIPSPTTSLQPGLWQAYCTALDTWPLASRIATGIVATIVSDALAQLAELQGKPQRQARYDAARTARLCLYSAVIGTPLAYHWFQFLDSAVFPAGASAAMYKMLADQLTMSPFGTMLFLASIKVLEGCPQQALPHVRAKLGPTLRASYLLWPAAHLINFSLVPASQRLLYVNLIGILWGVYMSYIANSQADQEPGVAGDGRSDRRVQLSRVGREVYSRCSSSGEE